MTHTSLVILGRQPALGLAELDNLYGAKNIRRVSHEAAQLTIEPSSIDLSRLGGSIKLCKVLVVFETTKWHDIQKSLEDLMSDIVKDIPPGKIQLGLSVFGLSVNSQQIMAVGLNLKKSMRNIGRSARLVPTQEHALNSAQVLHNQLIGPTGCELVLVRDGDNVICAQTIAEQDIESYTLRDRMRPKRDARVGMLPPKLAQIIINLAENTEQSPGRLLDPFCGTGVILQEALLLGHDVYGTDLEPRMIEYTNTNLDWLRTKLDFAGEYDLSAGDATSFRWNPPLDLIASETYLGQPFSALPSLAKLEQVQGTCNAITEKFLVNIRNQIKPETRLCLAIPAWQRKPGQFTHLPVLDHLEKLGYNRISFEHARTEDLLYFREDQVVARELLVITRK